MGFCITSEKWRGSSGSRRNTQRWKIPKKSSANRDRILNYHPMLPHTQKKNDKKMLLKKENWKHPGNRLEESGITCKYSAIRQLN